MSLQSLPPEILYQIISYLDPRQNIRTLRHLILACPKSSTIKKVADDRLRGGRKWLLDQRAFNHLIVNLRDAENFGDQEGLRMIAKSIIGKQVLPQDEISDEEEWAFDPRSLPIAKWRFCYTRPKRIELSSASRPEAYYYYCTDDHPVERHRDRSMDPLRRSDLDRLSIETDYESSYHWERTGSNPEPKTLVPKVRTPPERQSSSDPRSQKTIPMRKRLPPRKRRVIGWGMVCIDVHWG